MGDDLRRQAAGLDHVRFLGRLHPSELGEAVRRSRCAARAVDRLRGVRHRRARGLRPKDTGDRARPRRLDRSDRRLGRRAPVSHDDRAPRGDGQVTRRRGAACAARESGVTTHGSACGARTSTSRGTTPRSRRRRGSVDDGRDPDVPRGRERPEAVMHRAGAVRGARCCDRGVGRHVPHGARARHGPSGRRAAGAGGGDHVRRRLRKRRHECCARPRRARAASTVFCVAGHLGTRTTGPASADRRLPPARVGRAAGGAGPQGFEIGSHGYAHAR